MNRGEALDKIVRMQALADRAGSEGERQAALAGIERLREQFGIDDREMKRAMDIEEAGGVDSAGIFGTGPKLWWYERRIQPHVDIIREELEKALAKIETQDPTNKLSSLCELYDDVRAMVDERARDAWLGKLNLQRVRNAAIREAYREARDNVDPQEYWGERAPFHIHDKAIGAVQRMTNYRTNLTKATIESLVGVSTKKLEQDYWAKAQKENE